MQAFSGPQVPDCQGFSGDQTGKGMLVDTTSPGYFPCERQGAESFLCTKA